MTEKAKLAAKTAAIAVPLGILLLASMPTTAVEVSGGLTPVKVTIRSASGAKIFGASCEAFGDAEAAHSALERAVPREPGPYAAMQHPFVGDSLTVRVPSTDTVRHSVFGDSTRRWQCEALVAVVMYDDGSLRAVLATIPDVRTSREMTVLVP